MDSETTVQEQESGIEAEAAQCCATTELASCCEPEAKSTCCGPAASDVQSAPQSCGCR